MKGTDSAMVVLFADPAGMQAQFEAAYKKRFSFLMPSKALVVEAVSVEAIGPVRCAGRKPSLPLSRAPVDWRRRDGRMFGGGSWRETGLYQRAGIRIGDTIKGPAIIAEDNATTIVEAGWQAEVTPHNHLV
jgi:5-oxoprolinase (ATP-hydrolysing)